MQLEVVAPFYYSNGTTTLDHTSFYVDENDTSVIVVADSSSLNLSYVDVLKYGYASNLLEASFYGFNAAINVVSHMCFEPQEVKDSQRFKGQCIGCSPRSC